MDKYLTGKNGKITVWHWIALAALTLVMLAVVARPDSSHGQREIPLWWSNFSPAQQAAACQDYALRATDPLLERLCNSR